MTSVLHPDRWRRVEELFDEATALPADIRARFLDEACGADAGLRAEVQSLLNEDSPDAQIFDSGIHRGLAEAAAGIQDEAAPIPSPAESADCNLDSAASLSRIAITWAVVSRHAPNRPLTSPRSPKIGV